MAFETPPFAVSGGTATYSAEQTRRAVFAAFARTSANNPGILAGGLLSGTDCQVTAPASGMSVNVAPGEIIVGGTEGGSQGAYGPCRVTSTTNLTIAPANSTNPRVDIVCATVNDGGYTAPAGGVAANQWAPQVITGTPTAGATLSNLLGAPALPASSLLLAYVLAPAGATSIVAANISNRAAQVALGSGIASTVRNAAGGSALQVQTGSLSQPIAASVTTPFNVPLTQPWPNAHVLFDVAGLQYSTTVAGTQLIQWGPYDTGGTAQLNKGSVTITNGGTAQNVTVWWLSLGY